MRAARLRGHQHEPHQTADAQSPAARSVRTRSDEDARTRAVLGWLLGSQAAGTVPFHFDALKRVARPVVVDGPAQL